MFEDEEPAGTRDVIDAVLLIRSYYSPWKSECKVGKGRFSEVKKGTEGRSSEKGKMRSLKGHRWALNLVYLLQPWAIHWSRLHFKLF